MPQTSQHFVSPYAFGCSLRAHMKSAGMFGDIADGLSTSWNNASRVFKGGTGAIAGGLGAAGAGLAAGGMEGANAIGGVFGQKPFSDTAINTAYGAADHYANMGSEYGKDFAQGLGMGSNGMAGTLQNNPAAGDNYMKHVQQLPGVTNDARRISSTAMNVQDFAAKAAPAAALGGTIQAASNVATGAPMMSGVASTAPAAPAATAATAPLSTAAKATKGVARMAKNMNSTSNPIGWGTAATANAVRGYEHYNPSMPSAR